MSNYVAIFHYVSLQALRVYMVKADGHCNF